jgi:hypothetical protein
MVKAALPAMKKENPLMSKNGSLRHDLITPAQTPIKCPRKPCII